MTRILLMTCFILFSCSAEQQEPANSSLSLSELLGGDNTDGFFRADEAREFAFPEDHGGHEGYRNEWWYLTGNLYTAESRQFSYQVTFFNSAVNLPNPSLSDNREEPASVPSAWLNKRFWMAHVAITDVVSGEHIVLERFSRESPGLAGVQLNPFRVWLENWSLSSENNDFPWYLSVADEHLALQLSLYPAKPLVLQGIDGLSQKSPEKGNASYYYSYTRLVTSGELKLNGAVFQLEGESWLDREWSTSVLADDQSGWDWFSLQFDDGQELMYYQLRDANGRPHSSSQGNWVDVSSSVTSIYPEQIQLEERLSWQSPGGVDYGTEWVIRYEGQDWLIKAVLENQLMDVLVEYWEGAVDVFSIETGERVGQGYVEMVRD